MELDRLPMVVAMPSSHPLTKRRAVRLADLALESVLNRPGFCRGSIV
jgi:DNA-binding transcriptional LysR family regulator